MKASPEPIIGVIADALGEYDLMINGSGGPPRMCRAPHNSTVPPTNLITLEPAPERGHVLFLVGEQNDRINEMLEDLMDAEVASPLDLVSCPNPDRAFDCYMEDVRDHRAVALFNSNLHHAIRFRSNIRSHNGDCEKGRRRPEPHMPLALITKKPSFRTMKLLGMETDPIYQGIDDQMQRLLKAGIVDTCLHSSEVSISDVLISVIAAVSNCIARHPSSSSTILES